MAIRLLLALVVSVPLFGCAYSIQDINVSQYEPTCVRQCSQSYSSCVSQGNQIGFKTETLRACRESYAVCTNTCPAK